MSQDSLESFGAYRKANELFDLVVADMQRIQKEPLCYREIIGILNPTLHTLQNKGT